MDYNELIRFKKSLVDMDESKQPTKNNQPGKNNQKQGRQCRCVSIKHLQITCNDCPVDIFLSKVQQIGLGNRDIYRQKK